VIIDVDAIMDFIFAPDEKRTTDVELEETFIPDDNEDASPSSMSLIERIKHESKKGAHEQHEVIRMNFISRLLDEVDELEYDGLSRDSDFGQVISYNTLFNYGFLKEV
jgi:hypothetical protein